MILYYQATIQMQAHVCHCPELIFAKGQMSLLSLKYTVFFPSFSGLAGYYAEIFVKFQLNFSLSLWWQYNLKLLINLEKSQNWKYFHCKTVYRAETVSCAIFTLFLNIHLYLKDKICIGTNLKLCLDYKNIRTFLTCKKINNFSYSL